MKVLISYFTLALCLLSCESKPKKASKKASKIITDYVNPFIGTGKHGHTYPGATVPFGMLQVSPVNGVSQWDWCSGYHYSDDIVIGFGHLTLSGTGIGDLNDILLMPVSHAVDLTTTPKSRDDLPYKSHYKHSRETATPGYYQVYLDDVKVKVELTSSERTAYHNYTFDANITPSVVLDLGFAINWDTATQTEIIQENNTTISGYRYSTGWAKNQKVFFVIKFSEPIQRQQLYADGRLIKNTSAKGTKVKAQWFFKKKKPNQLQVKLALSSVSIANAKINLGNHQTFNFEEVKQQAHKKWDNALSKIHVETSIDSLKTIFYTALYHSQLSPVTFSDANGQFRKENDSIHTAKNFITYSTLSLWDTFRAEHPLLTFLAPNRVSDIIQSMLIYYEARKTLPVWTLYANETNTMTGYHAVSVIAEAYLKGIRDFDVEKAYDAMKTTMMQDRRGLKHYKKYGYIPYNLLDESVTITLEFAYNDWCVAQMAKALGKSADYEYFLNRSKAYRYLYDKKTGFMRGVSEDGKSFREPFDPKHSNHREHTDYTEGNAWQHSWFVPQDVKGLIALHGRKKDFIKQLEQLFTESSEITGDNVSSDISGLIGQYAHGNEPSHHIAYMFNSAGAPWRTQYWIRQIMKTQYNTKPNGLSGNEDCGQMSAWYVFSAIGLYPMNPASATYEIGSPIFEKTILHLPNEKTFTIEAVGVSDKNIYIQSAKLNGETFNQTTLSHKTIFQGGTLRFVMDKDPNENWGVSP